MTPMLMDHFVLQVYNEVVSRRAHTAVVYVFVGFLNVIGTIGGLLWYGAVVNEELNPLQPQPVGDTTQHIQVGDQIFHISSKTETSLALSLFIIHGQNQENL